jgi:hypothetical protein
MIKIDWYGHADTCSFAAKQIMACSIPWAHVAARQRYIIEQMYNNILARASSVGNGVGTCGIRVGKCGNMWEMLRNVWDRWENMLAPAG